MNWLKKLFGRRPVDIADVPIETIIIEPDPDMEPGEWEWGCLACTEGGSGEAQDMRAESFTHCIQTGHAVYGNAKAAG